MEGFPPTQREKRLEVRQTEESRKYILYTTQHSGISHVASANEALHCIGSGRFYSHYLFLYFLSPFIVWSFGLW